MLDCLPTQFAVGGTQFFSENTALISYVSGYLDSSSINEHLQPGTKIDLPFWMARALCSRKRHIISADVPKNYRDTYREILTADANVVDLHKLGPYYYCFGTHLLKFEQPDAADISKSLVKVSLVVRKSKARFFLLVDLRDFFSDLGEKKL